MENNGFSFTFHFFILLLFHGNFIFGKKKIIVVRARARACVCVCVCVCVCARAWTPVYIHIIYIISVSNFYYDDLRLNITYVYMWHLNVTTPLDQQVKHAFLQDRCACVPIIKYIRRTAQCRRTLIIRLQLLIKLILICMQNGITKTECSKIELLYL